MRMILISDIHGIYKNIDILDKNKWFDDISYLVILGDVFGSCFEDNLKISNFIKRYKDRLILVKGNCDRNKDILELGCEVSSIELLEVDDICFYFTHGNKYNYYSNDTFTDGVLVYGHEHIPYIKEDIDMTYINVGSISLPRDLLGPSFGVYEDKSFKIYKVGRDEPIFIKNF